ncbi:MAG TPA: DUF4142 domain-containing protein [Burkholderiales bacterium]
MKGIRWIPIVALVLAPLALAQQEGAASFFKQAAEINVAEQEMAELAQERAAGDAVKKYAERMIEEHEQANEKLQSLAEKRDVELPDEPGARHKQQAQRLSKLEGKAFDQAYMESQVQAHQEAIKMFEQQAKTAQDPDAQRYAQQMLPALRAHLKHAQQLQKQAAGPGRMREQSRQR